MYAENATAALANAKTIVQRCGERPVSTSPTTTA